MKHKLFTSFVFAGVFLTLAPTAVGTTTWYVNGGIGSDSNTCVSSTASCKTIGHAISLAASGDSIKVAAAIYKENLTITINLRILGSGTNTTIIDGGGTNRVVTISSANAHVSLANVTIQNGVVQGDGAGVYNTGFLVINRCTITGNRGHGNTAAGVGGGIANHYGTMTVSNSSITGNSINGPFGASYGGGIGNNGTTTVSNSTLTGNSALMGGGIENLSGTLAINNSTISGNKEGLGGLGNYSGAVIVQNSIVANNSGSNCNAKMTITSNGYNLSSDNSCNFNATGDLDNTDPKLGPLQNNGGPTQTMALLAGSPAIDAGNPAGCTDGKGHLLITDQRGLPRPDTEDSHGCDMGAYERQSAPSCIPVGQACFGPGQLKCCPAPFPHHSFCSSQTGWGVCLMN